MSVQPDRTSRASGHARPGPVVPGRRRRAEPPAAPRHRAATATGRRSGSRARTGGAGRRTWLAVPAAGAALAVALVVVLAGGGPDRSVGAQATPSPAPRPGATVAAPAPAAAPGDAGTGPAPSARTAPAAVGAATTGPRTPTTTRAALEQLLAERAGLSTGLLRAALTGDEAGAAAAATALRSSSTDLERVLARWTGGPVAAGVRTSWDRQWTASRDYAEAVRHDPARADAARAEMGATSRSLGVTLDRLTDGRIATYVPPQDAAQLRAFVDALAAQDVTAAAETERWLRARLVREGTALADGLAASG